MSLISDLAQTNDVALAVAGAIEHVLGDDLILAVGLPRTEPPTSDVLPTGQLSAVRVAFAGSLHGSLILFVGEPLATTIAATSPTQTLLGALADAMVASAQVVVNLVANATAAAPIDIDASELLSHPLEGDFLVYPLLEGNERVACIVIHAAEAGAQGSAGNSPQTPVAVHQFQSLDSGAMSFVDPRPLSLLSDVEMGVTAELGRRRMTVRELLSLTPGSVIELDRAAGTPVDVLVNGTLIARGEVVVIEEEFGIRVSEIVAAETVAH